jgi:hypothetical protein
MASNQSVMAAQKIKQEEGRRRVHFLGVPMKFVLAVVGMVALLGASLDSKIRGRHWLEWLFFVFALVWPWFFGMRFRRPHHGPDQEC